MHFSHILSLLPAPLRSSHLPAHPTSCFFTEHKTKPKTHKNQNKIQWERNYRKKKKTNVHKNTWSPFVLANHSWVRSPPWGVVDMLSDAPVGENRFSFPNSYQLQPTIINQLLGWGWSILSSSPSPCWEFSGLNLGSLVYAVTVSVNAYVDQFCCVWRNSFFDINHHLSLLWSRLYEYLSLEGKVW